MWLRLPMIVRVGPNDPPEVQALNGTINSVLINTDSVIGVFHNIVAPERSVIMLAANVSIDIALTVDAIWNEISDGNVNKHDLTEDVDMRQHLVTHDHPSDHSH